MFRRLPMINKRFKDAKKIFTTNQPESRPAAHGWEKLTKAFTYKDITIKKGYEWDGASIPWFFWLFVGSPFLPQFRRSSLIHDYFCDEDNNLDRKEGDKLFQKLLIEDQNSWLVSRLMYRAVSLYSFFKT